jgi:probable F420-dependent oxidoreductase
VKVGIVPFNVGVASAEELIARARTAEAVGLESIWTFEHVVVPIEYRSRYPYNQTGKMGAQPETALVDPLIALTAAAASTSRIRLGTGVSILPQANPLLLAKQAASLDYLSGGRLMLGFGAGWLREEYEALGVPFARRGARFDDYVAAMKRVWSGDIVEHQSEFLSWSNFKSFPLPAQRPHPPIIIGGYSDAAIERVLAYGDGWFMPVSGVEATAQQLGRLRERAAATGRDASRVEISTQWIFTREGVESIPRYEELGVQRLIVPLPVLGPDAIAGIERLGEALARA